MNKLGPTSALLELTYRCNLDCIQCYCKGLEDRKEELKTEEIKKVICLLADSQCLQLTFSGGEPLIRNDFLELYAFAKKKGFLVSIFTNGLLFNKETIDFFVKSRPQVIEITVNGATADTYESICGVKDSFRKLKETIKKLTQKNLPVVLKSNLLKQNKDEIYLIKRLSDKLISGPKDHSKGFRFKYDPLVLPRLNGDLTPTKYRLDFNEYIDVLRSDPDIRNEFKNKALQGFVDLPKSRKYLYQCNLWKQHYFFNPYGKIKFCMFSDKFSVDLREHNFQLSLKDLFVKLDKQVFKTNSKCRDCSLRQICHYCPARAFLEVGNEEASVPYYCDFARKLHDYFLKLRKRLKSRKTIK
ncbi:MAG: radical SAM protein [Candidatus Gygaella obscura]|nr:radical SAM protein [Candidatus Gygaella obscura]